MDKFKVGDIVEMISSCGIIPVGWKGKLIIYEHQLFIDFNMPETGCSCQEKWKLVKQKKIEVYGISRFMDKLNKI